MSQPTCTCDNAGAEFPHRPWCATEHQHPGPDCVGLCEPDDVTTPADQPDLITWLRAQLDDDERVARSAVEATGWQREGGTGRWQAGGSYGEGGVDDEGGATVVYDEGLPTVEQAEHIARHDPARVLAEVDAKRRILDVYKAEVIDVSVVPERPEWMHGRVPVEAHTVLRLLALPYADRPGYRDEWRP